MLYLAFKFISYIYLPVYFSAVSKQISTKMSFKSVL